MLGGGLPGSKVLDQKRQNMLTRSFEPGLQNRPSPQGHGNRHERGPPGGGRRASTRCPGGAADGVARANAATGVSTTPHCCGVSSGSRAGYADRRATNGGPTDGPDDGRRRRGQDPRARRAPRSCSVCPVRPSTRSTPRCARHGGIRHTAGPARRGRFAHGRGFHPGECRQHRRLRRHLGPGGHRYGHGALRGHGRLDPHSLRSPGRPRLRAAQGRLPGRRHRGHRRAGDEMGDDRPRGRRKFPERSRRRST